MAKKLNQRKKYEVKIAGKFVTMFIQVPHHENIFFAQLSIAP